MDGNPTCPRPRWQPSGIYAPSMVSLKVCPDDSGRVVGNPSFTDKVRVARHPGASALGAWLYPRQKRTSLPTARPPGSGRIIAEQLLSLTRIQARGPLPSPGLPIRLRI